MATADSPTKTCGEGGCTRPLRARGLCSTHYNQHHQPNRHRKVTVPCGWCETPCEKQPDMSRGYAERFCSVEHRDAWRSWRAGTNFCVLPTWHRAHPDCRPSWRVRPEPPAPRLWTAGCCLRCGAHFVDRQPRARFCSTECGRIFHRKLWKEQNDVPDAVRAYVYERDGWRCQLCHRAIRRDVTVPHHLAPTVDHIVPRSLGGGHEAANLRAAHFICNARRGNRIDVEQLALVG